MRRIVKCARKPCLYITSFSICFSYCMLFLLLSLSLSFCRSRLDRLLWRKGVSHLAGTMIFPEQFMLVVAAAPVAICPLIVALRSLRSKVKIALVSKLLAVFNTGLGYCSEADQDTSTRCGPVFWRTFGQTSDVGPVAFGSEYLPQQLEYPLGGDIARQVFCIRVSFREIT